MCVHACLINVSRKNWFSTKKILQILFLNWHCKGSNVQWVAIEWLHSWLHWIWKRLGSPTTTTHIRKWSSAKCTAIAALFESKRLAFNILMNYTTMTLFVAEQWEKISFFKVKRDEFCEQCWEIFFRVCVYLLWPGNVSLNPLSMWERENSKNSYNAIKNLTMSLTSQ